MKIFKKLISLTVVMVCIATFCCSNAFALSWSGSTNIESNSPSIATSGFSVPYTSEKNLVGYRFSVVSSTGATQTTADYLRGSNYYMTTYNKVLVSASSGEVQNKYQLKSNYSAAYKTTTKTFTTYSSLPSVGSIESWVLSNADTILKKMGYSGGEDDLLYGDRLLVEPLFMVVIANEKLTMTISDIAIVGCQVFGKTGNVYSQGWSDGTWGFLANYTQKFFPNYLHTNSNSSLWSDLWSTAPTLSSIATFGTLLDCGYGVGVAFQNTTAKYTITYNANGGTSGSVTSQTKTHGVSMTISSNATPSRTGYSFLGWSTNSSATSATYSSGGSYTSNSSTTLYAVWKANTYTVTYNANGGTSGSVTSQTKTHGVSMTISSSATPSRTGYSFLGWSTSSSATSATYSSGGSYTSNSSTTLYAVWKANTYTISYNSNTTDTVANMPSSQTKTYGVTLTLRGDTPTRTGYTFQGWSTSSGTSNTVNYAKSASYTTNASDVLYAVWKINTCTITLNANGGTLGATTSYTVNYGGTVSLWSASWATREGYTFLGYSTDPNATTAEFLPRYTTNSNIYTITESDIWYAVWEINKCTITLNANGGMLGSITSYTVDYGSSISLWSASWATRTGYTFLGYSTDPNATTAEFLPRYTTNSNIYTITESDIWYAVWKVNTDIYPEFIEPNASYYSGIDIIASFNIVNDGALDFTQSSGIDVNLEVYSVSHSGISTLILNETKTTVIPKYEENLVYWKVSIPTNAKQLKYVVTVSSNADETDFENNSKTYEVNVSTLVNSQTEDTIFENTPTGFTLPSLTTNIAGISIDDNATWQVWEWVDDDFKLNTYGIETSLNVIMTADDACKTEIINGSSITMKSGYGIQTEVGYEIENYSDYLMPSTDAYTEIQSVNMYFPEYMYSTSVDKFRTLELVGDSFYFEENQYTMTELGVTDNRRTHFIPIYFPDETYAVKTYGYNLWTPAGMINTVETNTQIQINGDIFDDWVITR